MKRIGNIWDQVVSVNNGIIAVIEGTQKKRGNREVKRLLYDDAEFRHWHCIDPKKAEMYVSPICESLKNGTYEHHIPAYRNQMCPSSSGGKIRDLYIPSLRDHVVHHMLVQACMTAFTRGMHPHCCGSVPGRGIKHVVNTVSSWFYNDKECRYFVKLDIRKFFPSIRYELMMDVLETKIKDKRVLDLWGKVMRSAPECCPIGYYPSPWLSNLYLEDFDWFVEQELYKERRGKRIKYVRHYLRYADDMLLVGTSKKDLEKAIHRIIRYLKEKKGLDIKPSWEIKAIGKHEIIDGRWQMKPGTYWCDIGGYKFCKDAMVLRDGVYLTAKRLAKKMSKQQYYTYHQCMAMNASVAWAKQAGSLNFLRTDIYPYVDLKTVRRNISNVDKKRKLRFRDAQGKRNIREQGDTKSEFQKDSGDGRIS